MAADFELCVLDGATGTKFPFVILPTDLQEWIEDRYPLTNPPDTSDNADRAGDAVNQQRLGAPRGLPLPRLGLNELYHPPRYTEYTIFRGVMHKAVAAALAAAEAAGHTLTLRMFSGTSLDLTGDRWGAVQYQYLHPLPPRPLVGRDDLADLLLITLVDGRYWGEFSSATLNFENEGANAGFFAPSTPGAPFAVYGNPDPDSELFSHTNRKDVWLEAMFNNTGLVRADFHFSGLTPASGNTAPRWADVNAHLLTTREAWKRYRIVGGLISADPAVPSTYRVPYLPKQFQVSFPRWIKEVGYAHPPDGVSNGTTPLYARTGPWTTPPAVYVKTIDASTDLSAPYNQWTYVSPISGSWNTLASNSLETFTAAVNLNTTFKALHDTTDPFPGSSPSTLTAPDNQSDCDALATQLAKDYLDANAVFLDETYQGLVPFSCYSFVYVHWKYSSPGGPTTRVWRPPLFYTPTEFQHGWTTPAAVLPPAALVQVTGGISGGYYPGTVLGLGQSVYIRDQGGNGLVTNGIYVGVLHFNRRWGAGAKAVYDVQAVAPSMTVDSTLVSGGTINGVLYTDGSTLRSASLAEIVGNQLYVQAAANKWIGFSIGSH